MKMRIKTHPNTAAVIVLAAVLAQTNVVKLVRHALIINTDSAKTPPLNGLIVWCTILPQVHKRLKILTLYSNLPNPATLLNPLHPQNALLHHHAANATLIPLIMQVTPVALPSAVALKVTPTVNHTVVTVTMMIAKGSIPLVLAMMTILAIMISLPNPILHKPFTTANSKISPC